MDPKELVKEDIEFCCMETGQYFRAVGVSDTGSKPVIMLEQVSE